MPIAEELRSLVESMSPEEVRDLAGEIDDPEVLATLEEVVATFEPPAAPGPLRLYHDRPAAFARDLVRWPDNTGLIVYQGEILDDVVRYGRVAVRGPHSISKTATAAIAVLWFALTRDAAGEDWKIPTTAFVWAQLIHYLWPEIHKWAKLLRWDVMERAPLVEGKELLMRTLKLPTGEAFAASPDDAAAIEGAHAEQLLYVFDESKTIPPDVWDAVEGAFAGAGQDTNQTAYALAISTPGEPNGRFYDIHRHKAGTEDWHTRHVRKEEAVAAGRMSEEWIAQRARQWGASSALYQNRVEGEFASSDEDGVIPLGWVEAAQQRWLERFGEGWVEPGEPDFVGVDCSGSGSDKTALARRYGDAVGPLERPRKAANVEAGDEEMATAGRIVGILKSHRSCRAIVDVVGIGAGVVGRCREQVNRTRVIGFNAGASTKRKDRSRELSFQNVRAAAWWNLREMLDPDNGAILALPPDDELVGDLTAPHWHMQSGGKIAVESKDTIRSRLGRSTDVGDAVVQACWAPDGGFARVSNPADRRISSVGVGRSAGDLRALPPRRS